MTNHDFVFIGYNKDYEKESIEPYFIEVRNSESLKVRESGEPLEWFFTKEKALESARELSNKLNISLNEDVNSW